MTASSVIDPTNPLRLTTRYEWQEGDTLALIALKYRRPNQWTELLDHNKVVIANQRYIMKPGDIIEIPESWFPLPTITYGTKFIGSSITGVRI